MKSINENKIFSILLIFFALLSVSSLKAEKSPEQVFAQANKLFLEKNYTQAIKFYESILNKGFTSPDLYFNLGNSYYRENDFGMAILNYEKSLKLKPNNEDVLQNLAIANAKTIDKLDSTTLPDFIQFLSNIFNPPSAEFPSIALVIFLIFLTISYFIWRNFKSQSSLQILGKSMFFTFLFFSILSLIVLTIGYNNGLKKYGIIISSISYIKTVPSADGADVFYLHAGAKVLIKEEVEGGWLRIKLEGKKQGYCKKEDLAGI